MPATSALTYITTCKARLDHLRQTLPRVAAQPGVRIVVVDYGCPERSGHWVRENFPGVQVVFVDKETRFNLADARNAGGHAAQTPWLAFFDADILVEKGYFEAVCNALTSGHYYRPAPVTLQTWGSVICERSAFLKVGGYDVVYEGWGGEDDDFYTLLDFAGVRAAPVDGRVLSEIPHPDSMRTKFHSEGKRRSHQRNQLYRMAKFDLMRMNRSFMPLPVRQQMYVQIKEKLEERHTLGMTEVEIEIVLPKGLIEYPLTEEAPGQRAFTHVGRKLRYTISWDQ